MKRPQQPRTPPTFEELVERHIATKPECAPYITKTTAGDPYCAREHKSLRYYPPKRSIVLHLSNYGHNELLRKAHAANYIRSPDAMSSIGITAFVTHLVVTNPSHFNWTDIRPPAISAFDQDNIELGAWPQWTHPSHNTQERELTLHVPHQTPIPDIVIKLAPYFGLYGPDAHNPTAPRGEGARQKGPNPMQRHGQILSTLLEAFAHDFIRPQHPPTVTTARSLYSTPPTRQKRKVEEFDWLH